MDLEIRLISSSELYQIAELEAQCFSEPWGAAHLAEISNVPGSSFSGLFSSGKLLAYLIAMVVVPEAEILRIATAPSERSQGHARRLLSRTLTDWQNTGVKCVWLEVRVSNTAARGLYENTGFVQGRLRRGYYPPISNTSSAMREDAVEYSYLIA